MGSSERAPAASKNNPGTINTAAGAFLTLQAAIDFVHQTLDLNDRTVTIQVADGTYTGAVSVSGPFTGAGLVVVQGNSGTPANVLISVTSANAFTLQYGARLRVTDMKITVATGGTAFIVTKGAALEYGNIEFGADRSHTVEATRRIIERYRAQGYRFEKIDPMSD